MELAVHILPYLIWLPLELLAIAGMLRSGYRLYLFVFVYVIADFLTTAVEMPVDLSYYAGNKSTHAENSLVSFYWIDEAIMQVLVYAAVISLIYYATAKLRSRRILRISLIGFAVLFAGVSFLIHFDPTSNAKVGEWMTPWNSNLKFCSAILDLALWALLIASREKDQRLLMLSGALGIQFTGEAIGHALRNLAQPHHTHWILYTGDAAVVLFNLAFPYIVWQAFRVAKPKVRAVSGGVG